MPRFFVLDEQITEGSIFIKGEDSKHIRTVLRCKENEEITVCDGNGNDYYCVIDDIGNEIRLKIKYKAVCLSEPKTKVILFQGLPKADKMELIIQKCVELGVDSIYPVTTERSIVKFDKKEREIKKIERWQKISESAAKQSGRGKIPEIYEVVDLNEAIQISKKLDGAFILYEKEETKGLKDFVREFRGNHVGIFIGPEGGFTEEEINYAARNNVDTITLGKRILRTETAGLAALAILLHEME